MGHLATLFFKTNRIKKAILPGAIGTIVGGCLGTLKHISAGLLYGCIGFFIALAALRAIYYFKDGSTASNQI